MLVMRTLEIALIFRDLNEIYFPVRLDFRARVPSYEEVVLNNNQ
jgi:DNA-directed RNA polymerase